MASIHKDIPLDAHPDDVWSAVRDFGAVHYPAGAWLRSRRRSTATRGS